MTYQHFKGDFIRTEYFYRTDEQGKQIQIPVPEHVRIEYFTKEFSRKYVIERNGDTLSSCSLSADGMSLIANIALSRFHIGCGEMFGRIIIFIPDNEFPDGIRTIPINISTGLILWHGNSDSCTTSHGFNILAPVLNGYSAYELAKEYGYDGTEEEYAMNPVRIVNQFTGIAETLTEAIQEERIRATIAEKRLGDIMPKCLTIDIDNNPMVISHGLDKFPSVTIISSNNEEVECVVRYESKDIVSISWNGELTGKIYLI